MVGGRVNLGPQLLNCRSFLDTTFSELVWHELVLVVVNDEVE